MLSELPDEKKSGSLLMDFMHRVQNLLSSGVRVLPHMADVELKMPYFLTDAVLSARIAMLSLTGEILSKTPITAASSFSMSFEPIRFTTMDGINVYRSTNEIHVHFGLETPLKIPSEFDLSFELRESLPNKPTVITEDPHTINLQTLLEEKKRNVKQTNTTAYHLMLTPAADVHREHDLPITSAVLLIKKPTTFDPFTYLTGVTLVVSFGEHAGLHPHVYGIPRLFHSTNLAHARYHEVKMNHFSSGTQQKQVFDILTQKLISMSTDFALSVAPRYNKMTTDIALSTGNVYWGPMGRFLATSIICQHFISEDLPRGLTELDDPAFSKTFLKQFPGEEGRSVVKAIEKLYESANVGIAFPSIRMILTNTTGITAPASVPQELLELLKASKIPNDANQRTIMEVELNCLASWLKASATIERSPGVPTNNPSDQDNIVTSALIAMMLAVIYDKEHVDIPISLFSLEAAFIDKAVSMFNIRKGQLKFAPNELSMGSKYSIFFLFASLSSSFSTLTDFFFNHIDKDTDLFRWLASKIELNDTKQLFNTLGFYGVELSKDISLVHSHLFFQPIGIMNGEMQGLAFVAPELDVCGVVVLKTPMPLEQMVLLLEQVLEPFDKMLQEQTKDYKTVFAQPRVQAYLLPRQQKTIGDLKLKDTNLPDPALNGTMYEVPKSVLSSMDTPIQYMELKQLNTHVFALGNEKAFVHVKGSKFYEVAPLIISLVQDGNSYDDLALLGKVKITLDSISSQAYTYYSQNFQEKITKESEEEKRQLGKELATKQLSSGASELFNPSISSSSSSSSSSEEPTEVDLWKKFLFGPESTGAELIQGRFGGIRRGGPRFYFGANPFFYSPIFGYPYGYPLYPPYYL
jgi:hypothetical protein